MTNPRSHVRPGQPIALAADQVNWINAQMRGNAGFGGGPLLDIERVPNFIMLSNQSNHSVPRLGVLGIEGVLIDPEGGTLTGTAPKDAAAKEFARRPVLRGITPEGSHLDRFAVLMEPAAPGAIVRAAVSGVFACLVQRVDLTHKYATAKLGDREQLISSDCGVLQLLWTAPGVGPKRWAVGVM